MIKLLSIVVPVYNAGNVLERCLNSLIDLDYEDLYEVILVDDGSIDNSGEICNRYSSEYTFFKSIHQNNLGVSIARNVGIEHSEGKYITFVDADDYLSKNAVHIMVENAKSKLDLVLWDMYEVMSNQVWAKDEFNSVSNNEIMPLEKVYSLFLRLKSNGPVAKMFSSRIIKENQIRFMENINLGEDLIFNLEFMKYAVVVKYISEPIYMHVESIDGLSNQNTTISKIHDYDTMYSSMISFVEYLNLDQKYYFEVIESILQSVANYCGKLHKNKYSQQEIHSLICKYPWYSTIISTKYKKYKSILRKLFLKYKCYYLLSIFFKK